MNGWLLSLFVNLIRILGSTQQQSWKELEGSGWCLWVIRLTEISGNQCSVCWWQVWEIPGGFMRLIGEESPKRRGIIASDLWWLLLHCCAFSTCYVTLPRWCSGFKVVHLQDFQCTVEYYVTHFIVHESKARIGQKRKPTLRIDAIDRSSSKWQGADILIFNTAHWWSHHKTKAGLVNCFSQAMSLLQISDKKL